MNISKSTVKNIFVLSLLPVISLFSFLFYVFWTYPVQILSQELAINNYFLFDSPYLQTSLLVCVILFILLILTSKFLPKVFPYILGLILVFLIGTFLYKITSYDFGGFIDNNSLTTSKSILGYSSWYFALDGIIPIISIIITIFALKKNFYKPILLLFFFFYSTESILTLGNLKTTPLNPSTSSETLVLSNNHPNLIFLMVDSLSTPLMLDIINNQWDDEQKAWTKDFTFYDNVTTLSLGGTIPSLPNMIGGYEFSPQNVLTMIKTNKINFNNIDKSALSRLGSGLYYYTEVAFDKVGTLLKNNIDISVSHTTCILDKEIDGVKESSRIIHYKNIPIINASLYYYIPYIFKNNLASNNIPEFSFGWERIFNNKWISYYNSYSTISAQQTEKPIFYYFSNSGAHAAHTSPKYPGGGAHLRSIKNMRDILYHQVTYNLRMLNKMISILKEQNIYNSTRIIIAADHGVVTKPHLILPYLTSVALENSGVFYTKEIQEQILNPHFLPVTVMDKKFNTSQANIQIDSRFLSIGDLHGSIINTFTNNITTIDYLNTLPPKRLFNIPSIPWQYLSYLGGVGQHESIDKNGKLSYITIKDIKKGDYSISNYDFDNIGDLPPVEILE